MTVTETRETSSFMFDSYSRFYAAVASSAANAEYCRRVYGRNLCQHGFAEMSHLDHLIQVSGISEGSRVLDLGCGNGMISGPGTAAPGPIVLDLGLHRADVGARAPPEAGSGGSQDAVRV